MRIVLGTHSFDNVAGSETYLLTAAEHLQRLGHDVTVHALETGPVADLATGRGIPVASGDEGLPDTCDVALTQDAGMAHALAERYPDTPQVLVAHSELHDVQLPAMVPGVPTAVVVMSERVARRIEALDPAYPVVRLRQPVDTERFVPLGSPRERPRSALLLSHYQQAQHRRVLEEAWAPLGIEIRIAGVRGTTVLDPFAEIADADIVVGKGRAILDAMACGRPAYLYDDFGTDGWVTADTHPAMEADGFAGQSRPRLADRDVLRRDLEAYDPAMGVVNRELVLHHHKARNHAHELVRLFRSLAPDAAPTSTPDGELARNVRLRWAADRELGNLRSGYGDLHDRVWEAEQRAEAAEARAAAAEAQAQERLRAADERAAATLEAAATERERASAEHARLQAVLSQRRVQLGIAAGRAADRLRRAGRP